MDKLVSIITPCYNSGGFLHRLLDSILIQNYPFIEMYAVDDGSIDNTKEVIMNYIPKFNNKGYSLHYLYQENSGQSVAVNRALKKIKGDYLVWPDSDDFYATNDVISKMVDLLMGSDDSVGMIRCLPNYLDDKTLKTIREFEIMSHYNEDLFEDCLYVRNGYFFLAGGYMVKTVVLDKCIINREIYTEKDAGQNWQLMLPLLYHYRCLTIKEKLHNVLCRKESHSRNQYKSYEDVCRKFLSYENTLVQTLKSMTFLCEEKQEAYIKNIHLKYLLIQFDTCLKYKKNEEANILKRRLKNDFHYSFSFSQVVDYTCYRIPGYSLLKKYIIWLIDRL